MSRGGLERLTIPPDGRSDEEQPRWRQDFPIDWPQDEYTARRDFVKFLVLMSLAFTTGQFWVWAWHYFRQHRGKRPIYEIAHLDEVPVGGWLVFAFPSSNEPGVLVRLDAQRLVAYGQQCTHLSCPVIPRPAAGQLYCPCHEGFFDLATGRPTAGPPRRPLPRITLEVHDRVIYATDVKERTG